MSTFARVVGNQALDVVTGPDVNTALAGRFAPAFIAAQSPGWTPVPDTDKNGATLQSGAVTTDSGVSFTNSPHAAPAPNPISNEQFIALCQSAGGMTDAMLVACQSNAAFAAMWIKFNEDGFTVDPSSPLVQAGLTALAAGGYLPNGVAAVNAAWPVS